MFLWKRYWLLILLIEMSFIAFLIEKVAFNRVVFSYLRQMQLFLSLIWVCYNKLGYKRKCFHISCEEEETTTCKREGKWITTILKLSNVATQPFPFSSSATWVSSHVSRKVAGGRNKRQQQQQTKWWIDNDERDKMKSTQHPPSIWHPFLAVTWYIRLNSSLKPFTE